MRLSVRVTLVTWFAEASQLMLAASVSVVALKFCVLVNSCAFSNPAIVTSASGAVRTRVVAVVMPTASMRTCLVSSAGSDSVNVS